MGHSLNISPKSKISRNTARKRQRRVPRKVLAWGKKHLRSTKKTRADFRKIEAGATRRYGSKAAGRAVAGAARWKRLKARYKAAHGKPNPASPEHRYKVQLGQAGDHWVTLASFTNKAMAADYGRALKRSHPSRAFRVFW